MMSTTGSLPAPEERLGPLLQPAGVRDTKDPCPVYDGHRWHLYGSAGSVLTETWSILHATAPAPAGPWTEQAPATLLGAHSDRLAAPGVIHDGDRFHMFVQTDFLALGGTIEHLTSDDGAVFTRAETAIESRPDTEEAGLFDAHPALVGDRQWLVYAAMGSDLQGLRWDWDQFASTVRGPDVFAAASVSDTWDGPWERVGPVLTQEEVPAHVRPGADDYEWGLEGPQLLALEDGRVLLTGVCFVNGPRGTRQRVFLAVSTSPLGPYQVTGVVLEPQGDGWESGEVGHATAVRVEDRVWLFYQARSRSPRPEDDGEARWRFGAASWPAAQLLAALGSPTTPPAQF
jgi:hypothetical protein